MGNLNFDHEATVRELRLLVDDTRSASRTHSRTLPEVGAEVLGRDFSAQAARFHDVFNRIHAAGQRRINSLLAHSSAGIAQVEQFAQADEANAVPFESGLK